MPLSLFIASLPQQAPHRHRRQRICTCVQQPNNPQSHSAKDRLLKILPALINLPSQSAKVAALIGNVETDLQPPATSAFTELAISGSWRLLFSSGLPVRKNDSSMRLRSIKQTIQNGKLNNVVQFLGKCSEN